MEEDQELSKHMCKLCNKRFPCGRSLGGHMRSHMINDENHTKKKILAAAAYMLRENPKKSTSKLVAESRGELDPLLMNKVCKQCGKSFPSWKALFGHMKCHSTRISTVEQEEKDSWSSQTDNGAAANYRKKRSSRKITRYMAATFSSSTLTVSNTSSPLCLSEINEQQQEEEVAMSLIMLSRDVGNFVDLIPHVTTECSDANSQFLQTQASNKSSKCKDTGLVKLHKVRNVIASGIPRNRCKMHDETQVPTDHKFLGDDKEKKSTIVDYGYRTEVEKEIYSSKKRSFEIKNEYCDTDQQKISKFKCTTCNKSFHNYQALGGHKASHKTLKGSDENSTSIDILHLQNPAVDRNSIKNDNTTHIVEFGEANYVSKKQKGYECPICFKILPSGQALGGHKRSHLIAEAKSNVINIQAVQIQIPEIKDLLDLNLPAPIEEEESITEHIEEFKSWWNIESSHKHEQLVWPTF